MSCRAVSSANFSQMKAITTNTARIITSLLAYIIFLITSSCVIEVSTFPEDDAPAPCVKTEKVNNNADNIGTTGLVSLGSMQLL